MTELIRKPKILVYDIEVSPCLGWFWRTGKQQVGAHNIIRPGKIICISYRFNHWPKGKVKNLRWKSKTRSNRFSVPFTDKDLVIKFHEIAEQADILVGHNGDNFDRKYINSRLAYYDRPTLQHHMTEDTLKQARQQFNLPSFRLDFLCKYFNIPGKLSTVTGLWEKVVFEGQQKYLREMVDYCDQDVLILDALYNKIAPYVKHKLNVGTYNGIKGACPSCGGTDFMRKGYRYTAAGKYHDLRCKSCGKRTRGTQNLVQTRLIT